VARAAGLVVGGLLLAGAACCMLFVLVAAAAASPYFPAMERRTHRLYRVDEFLLLRHTD
jgi:hypothetical protein